MPDQTEQTDAADGGIRVLVADHDPRVRHALRTLIEADSGIMVVGEAANAAEVLRSDAALRPSVILLNLMLPSTVEALQVLRTLALEQGRPVVAMSVRGGLRRQALAAGAYDFVEIGAGPELILNALRAAAAGGAYPPAAAV